MVFVFSAPFSCCPPVSGHKNVSTVRTRRQKQQENQTSQKHLRFRVLDIFRWETPKKRPETKVGEVIWRCLSCRRLRHIWGTSRHPAEDRILLDWVDLFVKTRTLLHFFSPTFCGNDGEGLLVRRLCVWLQREGHLRAGGGNRSSPACCCRSAWAGTGWD